MLNKDTSATKVPVTAGFCALFTGQNIGTTCFKDVLIQADTSHPLEPHCSAGIEGSGQQSPACPGHILCSGCPGPFGMLRRTYPGSGAITTAPTHRTTQLCTGMAAPVTLVGHCGPGPAHPATAWPPPAMLRLQEEWRCAGPGPAPSIAPWKTAAHVTAALLPAAHSHLKSCPTVS